MELETNTLFFTQTYFYSGSQVRP